MSEFKKELLSLNEELSKDIDRDRIMSDCIYNRLSKLLEVQAAYFDESLANIQSALNLIDFSDANNLNKFNALFKNLHHFMGVDRCRMISYLIKLKNM